MRYYNLYPDDKIAKIESLPKSHRTVVIGKLMRKYPEFGKQLEKGFNDIITEFINVNNIPKDKIISIKRDAVFLNNFNLDRTTLGDSVIFIPKNDYHSFIYVPGYEFYVDYDHIDVKGINDNVLPLHERGTLEYIRNITRLSKYDLNRYLKNFVTAYKKKELNHDMYREFTSESIFRLTIEDYEAKLDEINEDDFPYLNISYNYNRIILPTIRLMI
jgi:hypothetical protein